MHIKMYEVTNKLPIEPAKKQREWMNSNPHSYRCVPLSIANQIGWDVILDEKVVVDWNGGNTPQDITIIEGKAKSHFGSGTLTFDVGYTWHTPPEMQLLVMPVPNDDTHKQFQTLTALVETDKLKYPWFLSIRLCNTRFTIINPGTKLCRVIPVKIKYFEDITISIEKEPQDFIDYRTWQGKERDNKSKDVVWQKFYHQVADHTSITMKKPS